MSDSWGDRITAFWEHADAAAPEAHPAAADRALLALALPDADELR